MNLDMFSDSINKFYAFTLPSLAPSTQRLLRVDIEAYAAWIKSHGDVSLPLNNRESMTLSYAESMESTHSSSVIKRKLSNIAKFWSYCDHESTHFEESTINAQHASTQINHIANTKILLRQPRIQFLIIILFLIVISIGAAVATYGGKSAKHSEATSASMYIKIPVINANYARVVAQDGLKLKLFSSKNSESPSQTVTCSVKLEKLNDVSFISILYPTNCSDLGYQDSVNLLSDNSIFVDIYFKNQKINTDKISVKLVNGANKLFSNTQGHDSSKSSASTDSNYVPESDVSLSSAETQAANDAFTKPVTGTLLPMNVFQQDLDIRDGDVVSIVDTSIIKALLDSPVLGVAVGTNIQTSGIVELNIASESAAISPGDAITTSLMPGLAQKASLGFSNVIGTALDIWPNEPSVIRVLLK